MATTKANELGQFGSKLTVHNENITLDGNVHGQYAGFDSDFTNALSSNISVTGNITVTGTVDGRDVATDGTKLDGIEAAATADQTKSDIEGLGIDVPATNLTGTIPAARLSTATTQAESDDSTKIATTAYVVDKITTLIGGAPSTLNDLNELAAAINDDHNYNSTLTTALGTKLPKAGGTMTGNLSFGDNNQSIYGSGADLRVFHSGVHSFVSNTTGNMYIQDDGYVEIGSSSGEVYIGAIKDGAVNLRYDNVKKIETTSTGIDVTGTVTSDGLTTDSISNASGNLNISSTQSIALKFDSNSDQTNREFNILHDNNTKVFTADEYGDIKFYEDTGTTAKFYWDASAERLGIGTTSPGEKLHISEGSLRVDASSSSSFKIQNAGTNAIGLYAASGDELYLGGNNSYALRFVNDGSNNAVFDNGSNIGIGTGSPSEKLHIKSDGNAYKMLILEAESGAGDAGILLQGQSGNQFSIQQYANQRGLFFYDRTAGQYRLSIDPNGNVGIGTNSPSNLLHLQKSADTGIVIENSASSMATLSLLATGAGRVRSSGHLIFDTGGSTEHMRIESSGNVGIGTSTNISSPLTVQSSGGGDSISIIGRANGIQDESVISFYENDGTTRNVYLLKERGDFIIATGEGGSASEGMRVTEHRTVKTPVNITQGGTNGDAVSMPNAGYLGSSGANFGTTAIFRTPTITSSASNVATSQFLTIYSSGHWGEYPVFRFRVYGTYYSAGYREYVGQVVASSATLIEVQNNSGSSYVGAGGNNTITMSNAISSGLANHAGQPRYKREFTLTSHGIYGRCYVVVEIAYGGNRYYSSSTSASTLDANGNSGGSYHFKTIPIATGGGIMSS